MGRETIANCLVGVYIEDEKNFMNLLYDKYKDTLEILYKHQYAGSHYGMDFQKNIHYMKSECIKMFEDELSDCLHEEIVVCYAGDNENDEHIVVGYKSTHSDVTQDFISISEKTVIEMLKYTKRTDLVNELKKYGIDGKCEFYVGCYFMV